VLKESLEGSNGGSILSFERRVLREYPNWSKSERVMRKVIVEEKKHIEDFKESHVEIDFANKMIGGGVLGHGTIQEEIRFMLSPELIVSLLFTAELEDNECIVIVGAEQFNIHSGYSHSFKWEGDFEDKTPL
jgi:poly(ADP-ribose) glycohydrolase